MDGPKSTTSFIEDLRASGNGSDATTLPTLISTLSKSSQVISGKPGLLWFWATGLSNPFRERAWSRSRKDLKPVALCLLRQIPYFEEFSHDVQVELAWQEGIV